MTQTSAGTGQPTLVRAIGRWDLTAIVINSVIGSGVFGLPATLVVLTGAWSPLAVVIGGLAALVIVLCFAEVASRFDEAGGPYLFARTAFGTFVGFEVGWLHLWTRLFSAAAVLNVFIDYSTPFFPVTAHTDRPDADNGGADGRCHRHQRHRRAPGDVDGGSVHDWQARAAWTARHPWSRAFQPRRDRSAARARAEVERRARARDVRLRRLRIRHRRRW